MTRSEPTVPSHFDISGNDYGYAIASLADGKILVAGRAGDDVALVRLLGDSDQTAAAANQAPVNSVPAAQTTLVNQPLAFTDYRGNLISISDADSGANAVEVTLTADKGTITLLNPDPSGRLTYLAGDGTEDATMTFTGTVADINTAWNGSASDQRLIISVMPQSRSQQMTSVTSALAESIPTPSQLHPKQCLPSQQARHTQRCHQHSIPHLITMASRFFP